MVKTSNTLLVAITFLGLYFLSPPAVFWAISKVSPSYLESPECMQHMSVIYAPCLMLSQIFPPYEDYLNKMFAVVLGV